MNKWKKAISTGMTATLLASLFTAMAASTALASVAVTSAGSVPQGGTSTGSATFLFTENSAGALPNAADTITVTINGPTAGQVSFSGSPVVSAPGSLGASASVAGNVLTISWTNSDTANVETISITGLKINAIATAVPGPIGATLADATAGDGAVDFFTPPTTVSVSGTLVDDLGAGAAVAAGVRLLSACPFTTTTGVASQVQFSDASDPRNITAGAVAAGVQSIDFAAGTLAHDAGTTVSQTAAYAGCTVLPGAVGVIGSAAAYSANSTPTVFPGESNSPAGSLNIDETTNVVQPFFSASGTTVTLKIDNAGVLFSTRPNFSVNGGGASAATLSTDRTTATFSVTGTAGPPDTVDVTNILYDVPGTIAGGTSITVTASLSGGLLVNPTSVANAIVGRGVTATATSTPVNIGQNAQASGLVTLTELQPGFFSAGPGPTNVFAICLNRAQDGAFFTSPGPWAKVTTTGAGALVLREGTTASSDNIVQGLPVTISTTGDECYYWTVWTASTVVSTIQIGNADFSTGPLVDVLPGSTPGSLVADILVGSAVNVGSILDAFRAASVQIATKVFGSQVVVTALSQPTIPVGSNGSPAGDIQVKETAVGQLKNNELICVEVLPNQQAGLLYDAFLKGLNTADVPVVEASNGLVVSAVTMGPLGQGCGVPQMELTANAVPSANLVISFRFSILQQSTTGNGTLVIKNIKYATVNNAAAGPIQAQVFGLGGTPTLVQFQSIVSNAKIGSLVAGTAATRLGVTQVGAFTTATKVQTVGKYVTYRFDFGVAAANQPVQIWGATKTGNDWSAFSVVTTRVANTSGVVYYYIRQNSATWKSYRAMWAGGGVFTPARQARWIP